MKKIIILTIFIITSLFGDAATGNPNVHNPFSEPGEFTSVDTNLKEMHAKNSSQNGIEATVGLTLQLMRLMYGDQVTSQNQGEMSKEYWKVDGHSPESMDSFNDELKQQIMSSAVSNSAVGLTNKPGQFDCYISRDLPFQYECSKTLLTYGGGVNETGVEARNKCKSECYDQGACYNASSRELSKELSVILQEDGNSMDFSSENMTYSYEFDLDPNRIIVDVAFVFEVEDEDGNKVSNKRFKADVYVETVDGTEILLIKRNWMVAFGNSKSWYIGKHMSKIKVVFYNEDSYGFFVRPITYTANYKGEARWFCPMVQDLTNMNYTMFAYKCPNAQVVNVSGGGKSAQICVNSSDSGDNDDGTYSSEDECESICREAFVCRAVMQLRSTEQVENFREGCLMGQSNCADQDCRLARITDMEIINETSFDANMNPTVTIISGQQVAEANRPRITKEETLDFEAKNLEEWKDGAYYDMVKNSRYNTMVYPIGEDTEPSSAFGIAVGTNSYGATNGKTELIWKLKPAAFKVDANIQNYLYAVFEIEAEYWAYQLDGRRIPKRDRIYYIKTSEGDTFKPFARFKDFGQVTVDERGLPTVSKNEYSQLKYETFSGSNWVSLASGSGAPYFKTDKFENPDFYFSYKLANDLRNINEFFPGMIRSKTTNGPTEVLNYTGVFDGTGDNIARVASYVIASEEKLTYAQVFAKLDIDTEQTLERDRFVKIYDTGFDKASKRVLVSDGTIAQPNINIYRYGKTEKSTMFMRIKPPKELQGQKAFIYVLIY